VAVCYKTNEGEFVATISTGTKPEQGSAIWSSEEQRWIPCVAIQAQVAFEDLGSNGPIFADQPSRFPTSFDNVGALCRWVIRSGGKVVVPTIK